LLVAAICAALPALAMRWAAWLRPNYATLIWAEAFSLLAVVVIAWVLLAQVFRGGAIDMVRVQGAVAVYLLLGAAYAFAYQIDWFANPAAFDSSEGPVKSFVDWIYFSFCTLITLGYGDIVPTSRMSRSLAIGEAITGQMYLLTIARLVAMQVSGAAETNGTGRNR